MAFSVLSIESHVRFYKQIFSDQQVELCHYKSNLTDIFGELKTINFLNLPTLQNLSFAIAMVNLVCQVG